jgi:mannonate dehydratase
MDRRDFVSLGAAAFAAAGLPMLAAAEQGVFSRLGPGGAGQGRRLPALRITDVRTILTQPANIRLVVVKVMTNEPGLYGLGCATFTQRARVVETAIDRYLKPFLIGKDPLQIEDIGQSSFVSSYWRNGPVLGNALSGVDMALWDIVAKRANMPLYQLFGGKCRDAVETYCHTNGATFQEVEAAARRARERGWRYIRIQVAVPGLTGTYGVAGQGQGQPDQSVNQRGGVWEPGPYVRIVPRLFEHMRRQMGDEIEFLHDIHERVPPILAMQLCRDVERFRPFFMEDPFSPEDVGYFEKLRALTSCPLAMGELFNNPNEYIHLISNRLIDFIRIHISQIGGLTPARKVAALCEWFNVRTAWHGPGDVSPVGHAANVHLDIATPNFGIQEGREFTQAEQDVFPGCPELRNGYFWVSDRPGLGIDLNETAARRFPITDDPPFDMRWGNYRRRDGAVIRP